MNTGQMLLMLYGITLFGAFSLNTQRINNERAYESYHASAIITAAGIGQSLLEQIVTREFDENTIGQSIGTPDSMTAIVSMGPDAGETDFSDYDDIDDFDEYTQLDSLAYSGAFNTHVDVFYAESATPETPSASRTFVKTIVVDVANPMLLDTLKLYYVVTY